MDNGNNTVIDTYNYSFIIIMFITVYINQSINLLTICFSWYFFLT